MSEKKEIKKRKPYTKSWEKEANEIARDIVQIYPCKHCGNPVVQGYCCNYCGSGKPY